MEHAFLQHIQKDVTRWRGKGYPKVKKETKNILRHIERVSYLHAPQREALETYIYLKEVLGNKVATELFSSFFPNDKQALVALGVSKAEAFDLLGKTKQIQERVAGHFADTDYPNATYALTMGTGKTVLMAVMMMYDFVLSFYYPDDERFAKNALVFAPDTTIIDSLKEIKTFDYGKVVPREYQNVLLNIKYHYLEDTKTDLAPIGNYNVIVSNSQKIILRTQHKTNGIEQLFNDKTLNEKRELENRRLRALRTLKNLAIFVDEAHHSYGETLEGDLKKTRQTIAYLHGNEPLVNVINLTGTPYINNEMIADTVYHFGLKEGIEQGILKQVGFSAYASVTGEEFVDEVVGVFWKTYGRKRLDGKLPKIAFYARNISDLQENLKPALEKALAEQNISLQKMLEYHTKAEENKEQFQNLNTPESKIQFVLLVGKGTEGWNCPSLVSCALHRKPTSRVLVLQSSTRCLRAIGDNQTPAHIFLSQENETVLDNELQNNFATSIEEITNHEQQSVEHVLRVEKRKKLTIKRERQEIVAFVQEDIDDVTVSAEGFTPQTEVEVEKQSVQLSKKGTAKLSQKKQSTIKRKKGDLTFYEIVEQLNRKTHLPCLTIQNVLQQSGFSRDAITDVVNEDTRLLSYIAAELLARAFKYEIERHTEDVEIELTNVAHFPLKVNVSKKNSTLVVYKNGNKSRLGFHINPYNFDSHDEKHLFVYLQDVLTNKEKVKDVYFTGGTHTPHNEFYVEYYNPEQKRVARYFPDFLIETDRKRHLVVEVKGGDKRLNYEANKKRYTGRKEELADEVFSKEVGFTEFQKLNPDFEYKLVFDARLPKNQKAVVEHFS